MSIINEAFKQLKRLNEETLDIDDFEGIDEFTKKDLKDPLSVTVIDPDAESDEDLRDSYIGKVILDCCVCHSKLYKDPDEVEVDDVSECVNVDEECPYCYSTDGFKVVGQVAPYEKEEVKVEVEPKEAGVEVEDEIKNESLTEARRKSFKSLDSIDAEMDDRKEKARKRFLRAKDDARSDRDYRVKRNLRNESVTESTLPEAIIKVLAKYENKWANKTNVRDMAAAVKAILQLVNVDEKYKKALISEILNANTPTQVKYGILSSVYDYLDTDGDMDESLNEARPGRHATYGGRNSGPNVKKIEKPDPDLSKKRGTMTNALEKRIEKVYAAPTIPALKNVVAKAFSDEKIDTPASRRLLDRISRARDLTDAQSMVTNSILAGSGLRAIKEGFEKVEIETDHDKIKVESEPKSDFDGEETIIPLTDKTEAEFKDDEDELTQDSVGDEKEIDLDVDSIKEESFNKLAEGYLKKVYENVKSYKTTKVSSNNNKLIFEGIINFNSGKTKKTSFIFNSSTATRSGNVKFIGENKEITRGKKSFILSGKLNNGNLLTESLRYNYKAKDVTGKSSRIYGRIFL